MDVKRWLKAGLLFQMMFVLAIVSPMAQDAGAEPVKIAVVGPHSGDLASYGIPTVRAAELLVEKKNKMGGINGNPIELVIEDDVCKPEVAGELRHKSHRRKSHRRPGPYLQRRDQGRAGYLQGGPTFRPFRLRPPTPP